MTPTVPSLVLLAAGLSRRYGGVKQLAPVGPDGHAILDYTIADAVRAGIGRVVVVVRAEIEGAIRDHLDRTVRGRVPIEYASQRTDELPVHGTPPPDRARLWGTAHALWSARGCVHGPLVVANADDYYGVEGVRAVGAFIASGIRGAHAEWSLVGYRLGDTLSERGPVNRAICEVEHGYVKRIHEVQGIRPGDRPPDDVVSMNLWAFTPAVFDVIEEALARRLGSPSGDRTGESPPPREGELHLPDVVGTAVEAGEARVRVLTGGRDWAGLTFPGDRTAVARVLMARGTPWHGSPSAVPRD